MPGSVMTPLFKLMVIAMVGILVCGCSRSHDQLVGTYTAVVASDAGPVSLELEADGKGLWSIDTDNAAFRWDLYQGKLRLHTKAGGVIEGTIARGEIQLALPGKGTIRFQRSF